MKLLTGICIARSDMSKEGKDCFGYVGLIIVTIGTLPIMIILNGWVLTKLWAWFVAPIFNIHPLTIVEAIGIGLVVRFITQGPEKPKKVVGLWEETKELIGRRARSISWSLAALITGWIIIQFI